MASIFNSLNIGYSGLSAAQVGIDVTGHNIANAETEGYTRQRLVTTEALPLGVAPGQRGNGTQMTEITRIFDEFVYNRYVSSSQSKEYSDTMKKTLEELSSYFPDIDNVGIKADLQSYFDSWQNLSSNPENSAVKVALSQQTQTLSQHIVQTRKQIDDLQKSLDDQIGIAVDEVNRVAEELTKLNNSISVAESDGITNANDLRDQRGMLELTLAKLIGADVFPNNLRSDMSVDSNIAEKQGNYVVQVGGFNIIDGSYFHPIGLEADNHAGEFNSIYYERQDGVHFPFSDKITGGKIGALLELRGSTINEKGSFDDGILQNTINALDVFAKGLIEATNNLYAQSATDTMQSNAVTFNQDQALLATDENFYAGNFDFVIYDVDGKEVARRSVTINESTTIGDVATANSIIGQLKTQKDDTNDNNGLNDVDDMISIAFSSSSDMLSISLSSAYSGSGYSFSIEDQGTNFAGVIGLNRFFDGEDSGNIGLKEDLVDDASAISAHKSSASGDNQTALDMVEIQFSSFEFNEGYGKLSSSTIYSFYDEIVTRVGTRTNSALTSNETISAQLNAIKQEYDSITKVSIDEEMANLIRYQTSYGAAAKVISTIDQMMTTLLGIKQ